MTTAQRTLAALRTGQLDINHIQCERVQFFSRATI